MGENCNICSFKCYGVDNYHGSCCTIEDRDWIIGPHPDNKEFLKRLSEKFGREIKYQEVFIDYEEGKNLFPEKNVWQNESAYPALRVNLTNPKKYCIFYNETLRACSVYSIRPETCRNYECDYLKNNT